MILSGKEIEREELKFKEKLYRLYGEGEQSERN